MTTWGGGGGGGGGKIKRATWIVVIFLEFHVASNEDISTSSKKNPMKITHENLAIIHV